jgi:hypothetical protein
MDGVRDILPNEATTVGRVSVGATRGFVARSELTPSQYYNFPLHRRHIPILVASFR